MTPNQRDVFMYSWAQRRKRGRLGNALLCAGIGAAGGVLFGLMMSGGLSSQLTPGNLASPSTHSISLWLGNVLTLFALAIPAFAALAAKLGDTVYRSNEAMYRRFLECGAPVPTAKPVLKANERGPQIAVAIAAVIIAGCIIALWVALG